MTAVSVIIPCYNDGPFLEATLQSVFAQTRAPDEIVVVDDGSTDDSAKVAQRHAPRVRLVSQSNQGISAARNRALAEATGDVIAFLDADDLWTPDSLAVRLERLEAAPRADCVFGLTEQFLSEELDEATRARLYCPPGAVAARFAGAMVARREVFDRVGGFSTDIKVGEMIDWIARLNELAIPTATVDVLAMRRRIHGGNSVLREKASHGDYLRALKASLDRKAAAAASGA